MAGMDIDPTSSVLVTFLEEARDHLATIEADLLSLERAASVDDNVVNRVFRAAHSIKGGAAFLGLSKIRELSHRTENVLSRIRDRALAPSHDLVGLLLRAFDALRLLVEDVESSEQASIEAMVAELVQAFEGQGAVNPAGDGSLIRLLARDETTLVHALASYPIEEQCAGGRHVHIVGFTASRVDAENLSKHGVQVLAESIWSGTAVAVLATEQDATALGESISSLSPRFIVACGEPFGFLERETFVLPLDPLPVAPLQPQADPSPPLRGGASKDQVKDRDASLRVRVKLLEQLMNLAGELVLSRNQLLDAVGRQDGDVLRATSQRINIVTSELQEAIMLTRMQPIGSVFSRFARVVRDLAQALGKEAVLVTEGDEVEVDKSILEAMSDPLTHLVRNALDHGLENAESRVLAGKSPGGTLWLRAMHAGGQIHIEVADDGRGIDPARIGQSALGKGLITEDRLRSMTPQEMMGLIFLPGFSTAASVSDISGRGVGMDVVKTNLSALGGSIEIQSEVGKGTTFSIKIPLTLAIIPSLIVETAGQSFAIPQMSVQELILVRARDVARRIRSVGERHVISLRGELMPIVDLAELLGVRRTIVEAGTGALVPERRNRLRDRRELTGTSEVEDERRQSTDRRFQQASNLYVVVLQAGAIRFALVVDTPHDTVEIVVKPLGRPLRRLRQYSGATIMGNGQVALILDVAGLADLAHVREASARIDVDRGAELLSLMSGNSETVRFMMFQNGESEPCLVLLDMVRRVEQCSWSDIQKVGDADVVVRRGRSLQVFELSRVLPLSPLPRDESLIILVFSASEHEFGILARAPVDIHEAPALRLGDEIAGPGIAGTLLVGDASVLVVDVHGFIEAVRPEWFVRRAGCPSIPGRPRRLLLAEDSELFRHEVSKVLRASGYEVDTANDGLAALGALEAQPSRYDVLITDIEMPGMDGLELTRRLRATQAFLSLPIIALSSLCREEDLARGRAAGVTAYQAKLDKDRLLRCLDEVLCSQTRGVRDRLEGRAP